MKRKAINVVIAIFYYIASLTNFNTVHAQSSLSTDQWQVEHDQTNLSIMVNGSGQSDDEVKRQLVWGQVFALLGAFSFVICNKVTAYDVDVWAAAGVYFTAANFIIKKDENKMAELVVKNHKAEEELIASLSSDKKLERSNQVKTLEEILNVQRETIKLIKRQNQLLKTMRTIYYSSLGLLIALIILSKTVYGNAIDITEASLQCKQSKEGEFSSMLKKVGKTIMDLFGTASMIKSGFGLMKSFSYLKAYPENSILRTAYNELQHEQANLQHEQSQFMLMLSDVFNQLIPSANAQLIKSLVKSSDVIATEAKTNSWIEKAANKVNKTILSPYARLALYGVMGTVTQFGVSRNNKDIETYTNKINYFDKQVQELKANIGQGLLKNDTTPVATTAGLVDNKISDKSLNSCIKVGPAQNYLFDETCECKKSNTCIDLNKNVPATANAETKKLFNNLNSLFNGDSSFIYDDKKADALAQSAVKVAESNMEELNKLQLSKGEKPLDMQGNVNKILKSSFYNPKEKLASNTSANKVGLSKTDITDLGLDIPDSKNNRSGIHLQSSDMENVPLQDIHQDVDDSVFDVISLRYKKTALPLFTTDQAAKR